MQKTIYRRVSIHTPDAHKPPRDRCSGKTPDCHMGHYYSVPAVTQRGTFPISHMVSDEALAGLAILYRNLGGERW